MAWKNTSPTESGILEYYLTDDRGTRTTAVIKGSLFTVHMKVEFSEHVPAPIFAVSFKDVKGTEITGTNSMIEKIQLLVLQQALLLIMNLILAHQHSFISVDHFLGRSLPQQVSLIQQKYSVAVLADAAQIMTHKNNGFAQLLPYPLRMSKARRSQAPIP